MIVTGSVEPFATVRPERVTFRGSIGQQLVSRVQIIPRPDYPFKIMDMRARYGWYIRFNLEEKEDRGRSSYQLTVENTLNEKGRYADTIYLLTDSPIRSRIPIHVIGFISDAEKKEN